MMTRREKLLVRPWQLRKYNNHKKKVVNAKPVIDFGPPPGRGHVVVKLKKLQKERERQMKIEEDNFKLLQNLGSLMRKKRVDNYWETKPPTFLGRVSIYHRTRTPTPCEIITPEIFTTRKPKCLACNPQHKQPPPIPEERIPWEPNKKVLTRRMSGSAVVPVTSDFDFSPSKKSKNRVKSTVRTDNTENVKKTVKPKIKMSDSKNVELPSLLLGKNTKIKRTEQRKIKEQDSFQITLNFPSFAEVKFVKKKNENKDSKF